MENWNKKYLEKDSSLKEAEQYIKDNIDLLNKGSLLDLASGDGRNSIYLAKKGFNVTAADFSIEALKRLESFANKEDVSLKTALFDLSVKHNLLFLGKFDNIIICNYKIDNSLLETIETMLNPNGVFMYITFNMKQHEIKGFNKDYCLKEGELKDKLNLNLLKYESINNYENFKDVYIFKK